MRGVVDIGEFAGGSLARSLARSPFSFLRSFLFGRPVSGKLYEWSRNAFRLARVTFLRIDFTIPRIYTIVALYACKLLTYTRTPRLRENRLRGKRGYLRPTARTKWNNKRRA